MISTKRFSYTVLAALLTGAPLIACGGQVSLGDDQSQSQAIDPAQVGVATHACPTGYQHANICCTGGNAQEPAQCEAWNDDPFHACDPNWTVYPNQAECCSLADPSQCVTCDAQGNCGGAPPPPPPSCSNEMCPPGWTGISPYDVNGCCRYTASGQECYSAAVDDDAGPPTTVDAGPAPDDAGTVLDADVDGGPAPDAGIDDGGIVIDGGPADDGGVIIDDGGLVGPDAGPPPPPPPCDNVCPPDWSAVANEPGVCCRTTTQGDECFAFPASSDPSANPPPNSGPDTPVADDAGVAPQH